MQARAQTFYFSSSGNDVFGNGTQAHPWQSLAKARSVLSETGGNVALLFKRGDEFYDTVGLTVTQPLVTIGALGDSNLAKPMLMHLPFSTRRIQVLGLKSQGRTLGQHPRPT